MKFKIVSALFISFFLMAGRGWAQESNTVFIMFEFRNPSVEGLYPDPVAAQKKVAELLASSLEKRVQFWRFAAGDATQFPQMLVFLEDSPDNPGDVSRLSVQVRFKSQVDGSVEGDFSSDLFAPADFQRFGFPPAKDLALRIQQIFESKIVDVRKRDLIDLLKTTPLGGEVRVMTDLSAPSANKPRAVLPLDWNRYYTLCFSSFVVVCSQGDTGLVQLHSNGVGLASEYPGKGYMGPLVQLNQYESAGVSEDIEDHINDLKNVQPLSFRLDQFVTCPLAGPNDLQLTIAP